MKTFILAACASAALALAVPAMAHHSGAMFDRNSKKTIVGVVKEFNWTNPHASFAVDVTDNGQTATWYVEMGSPNNLIDEGWRRSSLKVGDKVTAVVFPLKDGRPGGSYSGIILADGSKLGSEAPGGK